MFNFASILTTNFIYWICICECVSHCKPRINMISCQALRFFILVYPVLLYKGLAINYTLEPLWKGWQCLTKVAKFDQFPCTIPYKSCLFYPSRQATSFERPSSWVAFTEGFHCIVKILFYIGLAIEIRRSWPLQKKLITTTWPWPSPWW